MIVRWARVARKGASSTLLGWAMLGLVALGIVWIVVTGLLARATLDDVRHELPALRQALASGDAPTARALVARIEHQTGFADDLTSGPAWWVAAQLPLVGTPMRTSREMTAQLAVVGHDVLPGVQTLSATIAALPPPQHGRIDLTPLERVSPQLSTAANASASVERRIAATAPSWLPTVSNARRSLLTQLDGVVGDVSGANDALRLLIPMLGRDGPRRYFVGIMNEAESRGLGGLPGSFAIAVADHGAITFERFGSDTDLIGVPAGVDLGSEYLARYSTTTTTDYRNSTSSPDFRNAARIWASMWQRKTGERVDAALALDPTALSYLLAVTGPYRGTHGTVLTASNVVQLTEQGQYDKFGSDSRRDRQRRRDFLSDVARGFSSKLTNGTSPRRLATALSKAIDNRRLLVWSADTSLERQLIDIGWAGVLDAHGRTYTGFTLQNASGSKLDYYVERSFTYSRTDCGRGGTAVATLVVHSTAPTSGLPPYVTTRLDPPPRGARVGDELLLATYYATPGAQITTITVNGHKIIAAQLPEQGLTTAQVHVELPAGGTVRIEARVTEPAGARGAVQVLRQPLGREMSVHVNSCG